MTFVLRGEARLPSLWKIPGYGEGGGGARRLDDRVARLELAFLLGILRLAAISSVAEGSENLLHRTSFPPPTPPQGPCLNDGAGQPVLDLKRRNNVHCQHSLGVCVGARDAGKRVEILQLGIDRAPFWADLVRDLHARRVSNGFLASQGCHALCHGHSADRLMHPISWICRSSGTACMSSFCNVGVHTTWTSEVAFAGNIFKFQHSLRTLDSSSLVLCRGRQGPQRRALRQ